MNEFEPVPFRYTIPEEEWREIQKRGDKIADKSITCQYEGEMYPMFFDNGQLTDIGAWYLHQDMKQREAEYGAEDFSDEMQTLGGVQTDSNIFPSDSEE